ncbi:hypothetical protein AMS68_006255 [Peltaster fructicola]|uniref:CUE domain-containing protein n=1 Tax=Peltaster fructicola TaxID=286661 RepID=A0A6H0Y1K8_9PEZI|nr:hypothetical protein AMS68_006255 [Peltaster fructicola]
MALPVFAPYPPLEIRSTFPAEEWKQCLDAWTILAKAYLHAEDKAFRTAIDSNSFSIFLQSYYEQWSKADEKPATGSSPAADALKRNCFLLVQKCYATNPQHELLSNLRFLSHFSRAHLKSTELAKLLTSVWESSQLQKVCQQWKVSTVQDLEGGTQGHTHPSLGTITSLLYSCQELATLILTGSDFLESATIAYVKDERLAIRKTLVIVVYLGLLSLVRSKHANFAALSDHLYSLKAQADSNESDPSLLADLVTNTPLLKIVQHQAPASDSSRISKLVEALRTYKKPSIARKRSRARQSTGKARMPAHHNDLHIHRMSLVSQVQDIFPDLGSGFVLRLLDEYNDDVEQVTAHLLEGSLPDHLARLNRHEKAAIYDSDRGHAVEHLAPRSTPPIPETFIPHRANVFDDDDFDRLEVDTSKIHIGKKVDDVDEHGPANKAAILAALAAFDSDDDERDDTYDIEDVGGTVDAAHHDGDDTAIAMPIDENDMILYHLHQTDPETFSRAAETRRSKERAALKTQTGMTDEAIEGWAIMLQRDPKRARRLGLEATRFDGKQNDLVRTAYRGGTDTEDSDTGGRGTSYGQSRGRGGARGRGRGRGGNVAGPANDAATAAAQRRKEANKGSRANHNRRDQRARKMARGGFPGA